MDASAKTRKRPILFSGPMVRAILAGRKTQTRRVSRALTDGLSSGEIDVEKAKAQAIWCSYGKAGDRLWIRETWSPIPAMKPAGYFSNPKWINRTAWYAADNDKPIWGGRWRPSIHMPESQSRLELEIVSVGVEQLREISEEDAVAEGAQFAGFPASLTNRGAFAKLWEELNGPRGFGWEANPLVWVVEFKIAEFGAGFGPPPREREDWEDDE